MKRVMSYILVTLLVMASLPMTLFAADTAENHKNQIHIIVENTTYTGGAWNGTLVDKWVTMNSDSTVESTLKAALGGYTVDIQESYYGAYVNGINGLSSKDGSAMSGWMLIINGVMAQNGMSYYKVSDDTLFEGDEIKFMFSLDGGADLGCDYTADKSLGLKELSFSAGVLSPEFDSNTTGYTLTINSDAEVYALAEINDISENMVIKADEKEYRKSQKIKITDGSKIEITTQRTIWTSASPVVVEKKYEITVKKVSNIETDHMYKDILGLITAGLNSESLVYGNEWAVMTAARAGKLSKADAEKYYKSVVDKLNEKGSEKLDENYATTNARVILAITSIGKDAADVGGYNLLKPLADFEYITNQGINAAVYALLAINSNGYEFPKLDTRAIQTTEDRLIDYILENEISTGGWDWYNTNADADLTANVLQALAPYKNRKQVKEAIDRGINVLSSLQNPDGGYSSWGTENSCSTAQVLIALTELGISPDKDTRFVKNGYTILSALSGFYIEGMGFKYSYTDNTADTAYSTIQAAYALVANDRVKNNKNSLFNMKDSFETDNSDGNNNGNNNNNNNNSNNAPQTDDVTEQFKLVMLLMISAMMVLLYAGRKYRDER